MDNPYDDVVDSINAQYLEGATVSTETDLDDGTGASDAKLASQKAVKTYVDNQVFAAGNPIQTIGEITTNPTGVLSQDDFTVSWDNTSKIFTITPVTTEKDIYVNGVKHTVPVTGETCRNGYEFTIAEGMWYFFYKIDSTGNDLELAADQTLDINANALVAYGYYDSTTHTATAHDYLTSTNTGGNTAVMNHEIVKIDTGYAGGGSPGDYYLKVPSAAAPLGDETLDLDGINYLTTDKFTNITGYVADVVYPNFLGGDLYLELHQTKLGTEEHRLRHIYDGAQYKSGLELYNNVLAGNTQPTSNIESRIAVQAGAIADEDLDIAILNDATPDAVFDQDLGGTSNATAQTNPALIPILYRRISAGTTYWSLTKPMPVPFYHTYGTTYPYYDNAGTLTAVTAGYSVPYFIVATNHKKYPIMAIAGQAQYSTADAAMVDPYSAIDFGTYSASAEIKVLWRVVVETKSTWSNANHKCKISRVTDYRSNAGNVINRLQISSHSSLSNLDYASSGHTGFARTPYIKAVAPTVDEDTLSGYVIGDIWFDTTANKYYSAKSVGAGAASWTELATAGDISGFQAQIDAVNTIITEHGFLPKSQCAISGAIDANGYANFLAKDGANNNVKLSATAVDLVVAFANGFNEYGEKNYIAKITADVVPAAWTGLTTDGTYYLWIDISSGAVTYGITATTVDPEYEYTKPAAGTATKHYYIIPERIMYVDGGASYTAVTRVFLGEVVVSGSAVNTVITYALNGRYISPKTLLRSNTSYSFTHCLGFDIRLTNEDSWVRDIDNGHIMPFYAVSNYDYDNDNNFLGADTATNRNAMWVRIPGNQMQYSDGAANYHAVTSNDKSELLIKLERSF